MKFYLYRHIRLDKNEPFYIGKGKKGNSFSSFENEYKRAFDLKNRNRHKQNKVQQYYESY